MGRGGEEKISVRMLAHTTVSGHYTYLNSAEGNPWDPALITGMILGSIPRDPRIQGILFPVDGVAEAHRGSKTAVRL